MMNSEHKIDQSHMSYMPPEWRDEANAVPETNHKETETVPTDQPTHASVKHIEEPETEPAVAEPEKKKENPIESVSHWFSAIFSPLLAGSYGILLSMWLSYLVYSPFRVKAIVVAVTFVATCILPVICIFLLSRLGIVADPSLNSRRDRVYPFVVAAFCYGAVAVYYRFVNAPGWLSMFMAGGGAALLIMAAISIRWKISAHACGMGGLVALLFFLMCSGNSVDRIQWLFMAGIFLSGCVCTARLVLNRHNVWQVGAGFLLGFVVVILPVWFLIY